MLLCSILQACPHPTNGENGYNLHKHMVISEQTRGAPADWTRLGCSYRCSVALFQPFVNFPRKIFLQFFVVAATMFFCCATIYSTAPPDCGPAGPDWFKIGYGSDAHSVAADGFAKAVDILGHPDLAVLAVDGVLLQHKVHVKVRGVVGGLQLGISIASSSAGILRTCFTSNHSFYSVQPKGCEAHYMSALKKINI